MRKPKFVSHESCEMIYQGDMGDSLDKRRSELKFKNELSADSRPGACVYHNQLLTKHI